MRTPMRRAWPVRASLLRILCIGIAAGCTEDVVNPPPQTPPAKALILLTIITIGNQPDPDGYLLRLDNENYATVGTSGDRELTVDPGTHTLQLADLAGNCSLGDNPRNVTAPAGSRIGVTFTVSCPIPSSLDVTVSTTGVSLDPDGYVLNLSGTVVGPVGVTESKHFDLFQPGIYLLRLSSVAGNCTVDGGSSRFVNVVEGQTLTLRFDVTCAPRIDDTPGEKLVVSAREVGADANLFIMESNGSNRQGLTDDLTDEMVPEFSPDGKRILFLKAAFGVHNLVVLDLASRGETVLPTPGVERGVWSPDGSRIAFSRNGKIYWVNTNGTGETQLTNGANDRDPYWSPDGSRIAFSRGFTVFTVNADGTNARQVSANDRLAGPWSPDGQRMIVTKLDCFAYYDYYGCYYGPSPSDIAILNVDTGIEQPLTATPFQMEWSPVWSSDGQRIFFISATNGNPDVFMIPSVGGTPVNLTNSITREEWVSIGTVAGASMAPRVSRIRRP